MNVLYLWVHFHLLIQSSDSNHPAAIQIYSLDRNNPQRLIMTLIRFTTPDFSRALKTDCKIHQPWSSALRQETHQNPADQYQQKKKIMRQCIGPQRWGRDAFSENDEVPHDAGKGNVLILGLISTRKGWFWQIIWGHERPSHQSDPACFFCQALAHLVAPLMAATHIWMMLIRTLIEGLQTYSLIPVRSLL